MRAAIYDGTWFDLDKAERIHEGTDWDGSNHISRATGSQWDHQDLYRTASGKWVRHDWSQRDWVRDSYNLISAKAAAQWVVVNGRDVPQELASLVADLEVA